MYREGSRLFSNPLTRLFDIKRESAGKYVDLLSKEAVLNNYIDDLVKQMHLKVSMEKIIIGKASEFVVLDSKKLDHFIVEQAIELCGDSRLIDYFPDGSSMPIIMAKRTKEGIIIFLETPVSNEENAIISMKEAESKIKLMTDKINVEIDIFNSQITKMIADRIEKRRETEIKKIDITKKLNEKQ